MKGRNGWFTYNGHFVYGYREILNDTPEVSLSLYSSHSGKSAPVMIEGPVSDVIELLETLVYEARTKNKEKEGV